MNASVLRKARQGRGKKYVHTEVLCLKHGWCQQRLIILIDLVVTLPLFVEYPSRLC